MITIFLVFPSLITRTILQLLEMVLRLVPKELPNIDTM